MYVRYVAQDQRPTPALPPIDASAVNERRSRLPGDDVDRAVASLFELLANPARLRILTALREGPLSVRDLAILAETSESMVSHHLARLREHGLVEFRRSGRIIFYSLCDKAVADLIAAARPYVRAGQA